MTDTPSAGDAARLLANLAKAAPGKRQIVTAAELTPELALLRSWQTERLKKTYADLLQSKRYRPAAEFFLSDIYAPRDFSQRNADMERFHQGVSKVLPERAVSILTDAVDLYQLSDRLDLDMARVLFTELGAGETITVEQYGAAYRILDNCEERLRQIELVGQIGYGVDKLIKIPFIGATLKLAHTPAVLTGWSELQGFLERGYAAFKHMNGAAGFLQPVRDRETRILDALYSGAADPFAAHG